jgi:hypothetical protein
MQIGALVSDMVPEDYGHLPKSPRTRNDAKCSPICRHIVHEGAELVGCVPEFIEDNDRAIGYNGIEFSKRIERRRV